MLFGNELWKRKLVLKLEMWNIVSCTVIICNCRICNCMRFALIVFSPNWKWTIFIGKSLILIVLDSDVMSYLSVVGHSKQCLMEVGREELKKGKIICVRFHMLMRKGIVLQSVMFIVSRGLSITDVLFLLRFSPYEFSHLIWM